MHRTKEQWAAVNPDAFLVNGSTQQARNVIEMMQQDIAELYLGTRWTWKVQAPCRYIQVDGVAEDEESAVQQASACADALGVNPGATGVLVTVTQSLKQCQMLTKVDGKWKTGTRF